MTHKIIAEYFGTFTLVFAGTGAIVVDDMSGGAVTHVGVALTFGLVVMAMIYAIGDVSGAHINPAVTVAFCVARRISPSDTAVYVASQVAGAVTASLLVKVLFSGRAPFGATLPHGSDMQSFTLEAILTLILMFVILCVATGSREQGIMAGAAIGAVVCLEAMFGGPISGASMNPARSLGPALVAMRLDQIWIYIGGPLLGATLAVPLWRSSVGTRLAEAVADERSAAAG